MRKISLFVLVGALICLCVGCGKEASNIEQNPIVPNNGEVVQDENKQPEENVNNEVVNPEEDNKPSEEKPNETKPEEQKPEEKPEKPVEELPEEKPEQKPVEDLPERLPEQKPNEDVKEEVPEQKPSEDVKEETPAQGTSLADLITFLYDDSKVEVNARFEQEIPADQSFSYVGLSEEDFNKYIEESIVSESMMMPANYSLCIVKVKAGENVETVKKNIFDNANARKWICMAAENVMVTNSDNYVMLVMSTKDNCDSLFNSFTKHFNGNIGGKLERAGE